MKSLLIATALISSSFYTLSAAAEQIVITKANGYNWDAKRNLQKFEAMAIDDQGKVLEVGNEKAILSKYPKAKLVDVKGKTILPGLIDAHGHVFNLGKIKSQLNLRDTTNLKQAQEAIAQYAKKFPQQQWILGGGWNQAIWKLGRFPFAKEIDVVVAERPVWLKRIDGHAAWANSKALSLAGITSKTKDPVGGKIERDEKGNATGILVDSAMDLMEKVLPASNQSEQKLALDAALEQMRSVGLTSVHDAGVNQASDTLFREYANQGKLTTRIYGMIGGVDLFFDAVSKSGPLMSLGNDQYALRAVKLYTDGALGSRGAALMQPYSDAPHTKGLLFSSDKDMAAMIAKAAAKGYQVNVHAIGDAGNRQVIESFAKLPKSSNASVLRHRVEHAQIVDLSDIERINQLGLIPSMQPTHATSDMNMAEDRVGAQRLKGAYAWRTFLKQGARIACGSDFPIESPNPFWGIHAAVTRQDMQGQPVNGWHAEQAMSVEEALKCFTIDAAYAGNQEKIVGSLEKGKWADFVVVDQDIFTMPKKDIYKIKVLQTWQAGRVVFQQ